MTTERAKKIKFIITDVDGVLTDGKLNFFLREDGSVDEFKSFNAKDAIACILSHKAGIGAAIVTGRAHQTTVARAHTMRMSYIYQGWKNKKTAFEEILRNEGLRPEETAVIGDDLIDLPMLEACGLPCCPADSKEDVKKACALVTRTKGGDGVLSEVIEFILKAQGVWEKYVDELKEHGVPPNNTSIEIFDGKGTQ